MKTLTTRTAALAIMTLAAAALAGTAFAQTGGSMSGPSSTPASSGSMSGGSMASPAGSTNNTMSGAAMQGQNTKTTTANKKKAAGNGVMGSPAQPSGSMGSTPH